MKSPAEAGLFILSARRAEKSSAIRTSALKFATTSVTAAPMNDVPPVTKTMRPD